MQRLAHMSGICKLHDYGINRQGIYLVMTRYTCSLRTWLAKQTVKPSMRLRLYMEIFYELADLLEVSAFSGVTKHWGLCLCPCVYVSTVYHHTECTVSTVIQDVLCQCSSALVAFCV